MNRALLSTASAVLLMTSACSGSGGGGSPAPTPTPTPPNTAPSFTSATAISVPENVTGTIYTATGTDPEGDPVSFRITGGDDAALFQITPAGALSFINPPDFELPADKDRDNKYNIQLTINDPAGLGIGLTLNVSVTDLTTGAFHVRRVTSGFTQPLYATGIPDSSGRLLVVQKIGQIRIVNPTTGVVAATPFLDVSGEISTGGSRGLLGLALAPDFSTSGKAYVFLTNTVGDVEIRRYTTFAGNKDRLDPATSDVIFKAPHSQSTENYGGWIGFGPDGLLYITMGDGDDCGGVLTAVTIRSCNARRYDTFLGKVLRVDPSSDGFPADPDRDYAIPKGNRFGDEMIMFGVRNPYRASFDRANARLNIDGPRFWFGDVGQDDQEEINMLRIPDPYPGIQPERVMDFNWPYYEGTKLKVSDLAFPNGDQSNLKVSYSHGTGPAEGGAVVGGYVYRKPIESLDGLYIFGDYTTGHIFSYKPGGSYQVRTQDFVPTAGTIDHISSFGEDESGNLYIVDFDGELFVVEPN